MILFVYLILVFFNLFSNSEPIYEKFSSQIIKQHRKVVLEPKRMFICALGGSSYEGIKEVGIGISTKGPGSILEGRRLLLFLVDDLLNRYNNDPRIRPYLKDYPFSVANLSYTISYDDERGRLFVLQDQNKQDEQLALIAMYNGRISYNINLSDEIQPFTKIHRETYEEAKKILEEDRSPN